jgi:cell division protein FtsQ
MEKVKNEKLKRKERKNRVRQFFGLILFLIMGFLLFKGGEKVARFLYTSPFFALAEIFIEGNKYVEEESLRGILKKSDLDLKTNIFRIRLQEVESGLESHPRIKKARVKRRLPRKLAIKVEERFPVAKIGRQGKILEVDEEGVVLGEIENIEGDLPLIRGLDPSLLTSTRIRIAPGILKYIYSSLKNETREINFLHFPQIILIAEKGTKVYLGKKDFLKRLRRLKSILAYNRNEGIELEYIDLRFSQSAYAKLISSQDQGSN